MSADFKLLMDGEEMDFETQKSQTLTMKRMSSWLSTKCEYVGFHNDAEYDNGKGKNVLFSNLFMAVDIETYFFGSQHYKFLRFSFAMSFDNNGILYLSVAESNAPSIFRRFRQYLYANRDERTDAPYRERRSYTGLVKTWMEAERTAVSQSQSESQSPPNIISDLIAHFTSKYPTETAMVALVVVVMVCVMWMWMCCKGIVTGWKWCCAGGGGNGKQNQRYSVVQSQDQQTQDTANTPAIATVTDV